MSIKIDTGAIESTAAEITRINQQLAQVLDDSRATVLSMNSVWSGQAADAAINAFISFESKYKTQYSQMLKQYSDFLTNTAASGYQKTESLGTRLIDMI